MKMHLKIVLIILAIICGTCLAVPLVRFLIYLSIDQPVPGSEVEEIRITAVERDLPKSIALNLYIDFSDAQAVQIHYGYMKDGQWYDFPAERYEIASLRSGSGVDALNEDHVVQIGQCVLICIFNNWPEREMIITDTAGSSVQTPLEAYYTDPNDLLGDAYTTQYCGFYEDYTAFFELVYPSAGAYTSISERQYLIVPLEQINAEYAISYYYVDASTGETSDTRTITGLKILDRLGLWSG